MKPMLARTIGPKFDKWPCFVQPKLNGIRALYQSGILQSRDEKLFAYLVVRHIIDELAGLKLGNLMLDGELYVHGWRLQKINGAVATNRTSPREDSHEVEFHVFDAIDERGYETPFSERFLDVKHRLQTIPGKIKFVETGLVYTRDQMDSYFKLWCSGGYEGLMARPDGPYQLGETSHGTTFRSPYLWKYKSWKDAEYECVDTTLGKGKADVGIGALILRNAYGNTFNCGTGFTDEERYELLIHTPIGKLVKVRYVEMTANGTPYPCTFLAVIQ